MAKRSRRPNRPARRPTAPGARPAARPSPGPTAAPPAGLAALTARPESPGLTEAELRRAAELEAEIVAREQAAEVESRRARARAAREAIAYDPNVPLRVRAAHEYAYVARDVRRIVLTAGLMVAILLGLHLAINVFGIVKV
jgi:hypothetical protein